MSKIRIGIDVGSKGAIAVFKNKKLTHLYPFPTTDEDKPDIKNFKDGLEKFKSDNIHVLLEDLHSIFGTSAKSNFSFGWINGAIEGVLISLGLPYSKVQAKKWQKEMWEGIEPIMKEKNIKKIDTKQTSIIAAKKLFPNQKLTISDRAKKPNDGIVDALLIAEYCRRHC